MHLKGIYNIKINYYELYTFPTITNSYQSLHVVCLNDRTCNTYVKFVLQKNHVKWFYISTSTLSKLADEIFNKKNLQNNRTFCQHARCFERGNVINTQQYIFYVQIYFFCTQGNRTSRSTYFSRCSFLILFETCKLSINIYKLQTILFHQLY